MALETIDLIGDRAAVGGLLSDAFRRPITYLRISVTDRCNLRCTYCMPEAGLPLISKPEILTFEEIERIVRAAASVGVRSLRLTGGYTRATLDNDVPGTDAKDGDTLLNVPRWNAASLRRYCNSTRALARVSRSIRPPTSSFTTMRE